MKIKFPAKTIWLKWAWIIAAWTIYGFYFAAHNYLIRIYEGVPVSWWRTLGLWLTGGIIWASLTPLIMWLARRFAITWQTWRKMVLIHIFWAIFFTFLVCGVFICIYAFVFAEGRFADYEFWRYYSSMLVTNSQYQFLKYWIIVGLVHTFDYYRKYQERELCAAQLETQLAKSQLEALRMQLNPHFLFNTLNSISVLMRKDVTAANRMLFQLGRLLRLTLANNAAHEVTLKQELEFLRRYLEIEQIRYRERLTVRMEIETAALDALVPQFVFQPLVENAIKHGISNRETDGLIEIRAERRNGVMMLQVRDNGPGVTENQTKLAEGIGLSNTKARLDHLYGSQSSFDLRNAADGGLTVTAAFPFHTGTDLVEVGS